MHNEKRAPGCLGYIGDEILPSYMEIIVIKPFQRIPINQPGRVLVRGSVEDFHGFSFYANG